MAKKKKKTQPNKNPNCDNEKCTSATGETRILPTGGGGNAILCHTCYEHEIAWRKDRNQELDRDSRFSLPRWESLQVYSEATHQKVIDNVVTEGFPRLEIRDSRTNKVVVVLERGKVPTNFRIHLAPGLEAHVFQGDPPQRVKIVKPEE